MSVYISPQFPYLAGPDPPRPEWIGRYQILDILGSGAQGVVYLAWDPLLECKVAIKVPLPHPTEPETRFRRRAERLRKEAQVARELICRPGVVSVFDVGLTRENPCFPDGTIYVIRQYVQGESLATLIEKKQAAEWRPSARWIAEFTLAVAEILQYAHDAELIHRDVKPDNILVDEKDQPWMIDFGLAARPRECAECPEEGTPGYLSPEQVERGELDARTDIWSLGVVLYQLFTGRQPFERERERGEPWILPERPRRIDRAIPRALDRICMKCLAIDAEARFASASELAGELQRWRVRQDRFDYCVKLAKDVPGGALGAINFGVLAADLQVDLPLLRPQMQILLRRLRSRLRSAQDPVSHADRPKK